jgi:O-antigen ligase
LKTTNRKFLLVTFFFCVALFPVVSLFWQDNFPLLNLKLNWLLYPVILAAIIMTLLVRGKAPKFFYLLLFLCLFYTALTVIRSGDFETLFRFFIAVLPFAFIDYFYQESLSPKLIKWFWIVYCLAFTVPVYYSYLQYAGKMPYYDFDVRNGVYGGRISGGYNKPMNLIAYLFPIYLLGFYFVLVRGKKVLGYIIILLTYLFLIVVGHRTALISYLVVLLSSFVRKSTIKLIYNYYRSLLNFAVGVCVFVGFYFFNYFFGLTDGLRGRITTWEAHAETFFESGLVDIIFGKQQILLGSKYRTEEYSQMLSPIEAHNNTFRTIIFFGIVGYLLYSLFMRRLVLTVYRSTPSGAFLFLRFSCFTFLVLYMITNEPLYYGSIFWPLLIWIFIPIEKENVKFTTH